MSEQIPDFLKAFLQELSPENGDILMNWLDRNSYAVDEMMNIINDRFVENYSR